MAQKRLTIEEREAARKQKEENQPKEKTKVVEKIAFGESGIDAVDVLNNLIQPKEKEETKTKRIIFSVTPSLYECFKKKAKKQNLTITEVLTKFIEVWTKDVK